MSVLRRYCAAPLFLSIAGYALVLPRESAADIFHLTSGGTIEGDLIETADGYHRIRSLLGIVSLPTNAVARIETAPSPFAEYEEHKAQTPETAEGQTELGLWCEKRGLRNEGRAHLQRALELNPDCEPARRALGYVRVGGFWVDGRTVIEQRAARGRRGEGKGEKIGESDPEKLAAAIQGQWTRRIQAIRTSLLESGRPQNFDEGRTKILDIQDPLAIAPLARVLGRGVPTTRAVLVEALKSFPQDEATLNLAVLALLDAESEIRHQVLQELARRKDPRVVAQFRQALRSDSEAVIRRAATGLALFRSREAVPDLIEALTARQRKLVEVPVRKLLRDMPVSFMQPTQVVMGTTTVIAPAPIIGVSDVAADVENELRMREVTVFRTDVLEALKLITGANFGFEEEQWSRWLQEQGS